jgi:tetratricopeptide (TPR) repeat protein
MAHDRDATNFHPHFSPWLAEPAQLASTLVGHHDIIGDFLAGLHAVEDGGTPNHILLVGPRGIGKSHILCLIGHYVSGRVPVPPSCTAPSKTWLCVLFTEEEYAGQNSLANFLLALFAKLREVFPLEPILSLPEGLREKADRVVVECCFERLVRLHQERHNRIVLIIDNLQKVFEQWEDEDHQRLRGFLSENKLAVILGSAQSVFKEVVSQTAAFHDFFEIRLLRELSSEEVLELLSRRFESDGRRDEFEARRDDLSAKLPAIEVLTGGNPRLVLFLYEIVTRRAFLDIETALKRLLEDVREYFVRRYDELKGDQIRKVLDTIAEMEGPATPKEIASASRLSLPLVNAQLKRLKERHYVHPVKYERRKPTCYDINERLFRIWRQTATVAGRQRFRCLADFLKIYFTPEEIRALYAQHKHYLRGEPGVPREEILRYVEELYYFQEAGDSEIRYDAFTTGVESLLKVGEFGWAEQESRHFAAESLKRHDKQGVVEAYRAQAVVHLRTESYSEALQDIEMLINEGAWKEAAPAAEALLAARPDLAGAWRCLGFCVGNLGEVERALEAFRKAAEMGQRTTELWTNQAIALNKLGRWEEALSCADAALALDSSASMAWRQVGFGAGNLGHHERALEAFRKAAELGQPTAELWTNQAIALNTLSRWEEALSCAEAALVLDPNDNMAWRQVGRAAGGLGRNERALESFRNAARLGQSSAELWTFQAIALNNLSRWEEALTCAEAALALDADETAAWRQVGIAAIRLGRHERALEAFRKAAELSLPTAELWTNQAIVLNGLGRREEALACAESALALDTKEVSAWKQLGIALGSLGRHERALEALRKAAELSEPTAVLWTNHAVVLNNLRRWEEALSCAESALTLDPKQAQAWQQLGIAVGNLGRHERALEAFRKAAEVGQPSGELWINQAIVLSKLSRWEEALACGEAALALDAGQAAAWRLVGIAAFSVSRHERALEAFRKADEVGEPSVESLSLQAQALDHLGHAEEALAAVTSSLELGPKSPEAWLVKAWILARMERFEEALECVERAKDHGASARGHHHSRGDILLLCGRFAEALSELDAALNVQADDWDVQAGRLVALGCLGQHGPMMEAMPVLLGQVRVPTESLATVCDFICQVAANCLKRGENHVGRGLFAAILGMKSWHDSVWFGHQVGALLRRVLDARPEVFETFAGALAERVKNEDVLRLLYPFIRAGDYLRTRDLSILERLFPEIRELVLDMVRHVEPSEYERLKRFV